MTMPPRLTVIGPLERPDHSHLPADATCYFWGEYTPRQHIQGPAWNFSPTNQLVSNFKKKLDRRGQADWRYKADAIRTIGQAFAQFWNWQALYEQRVTLIPIPPSKALNDPMFDDRLMQMLLVLGEQTGLALDIRDCLSFSGGFSASHESEERPTPAQLYSELSFDAEAGRVRERPGGILLFDDMLTTGAHFVAARRMLGEVFPGVDLFGQFVARRRIPNSFAIDDLLSTQ
jgi:predicted amidophosphoribosyltransferase